MTHRFAVTLRLLVTGPERGVHFEKVADWYQALESRHEGLLDSAWGFADHEAHADVDVELTVVAADERAAYALAASSVRAAIHEAHGFTPGWDEPIPDLDGVVYRLTHEEVTPA